MKAYRQMIVSLSLVGAALPAFAADNANSTRWTKDDITAMCHSRFGADDQSYGFKSCVARNSYKVGHDKTPGDMQELNAAKAAGAAQ